MWMECTAGVVCGMEKKKGKRRMGKRRMWEMLGEWQSPDTVKEECQGRGECLMCVTSTLSLFRKNKSHESSGPKHDQEDTFLTYVFYAFYQVLERRAWAWAWAWDALILNLLIIFNSVSFVPLFTSSILLLFCYSACCLSIVIQWSLVFKLTFFLWFKGWVSG